MRHTDERDRAIRKKYKNVSKVQIDAFNYNKRQKVTVAEATGKKRGAVMKKYIGVDLGGTNIRAAVVQEDGKILCMKKSESHPERGAEPVMETMISLIGYPIADHIRNHFRKPTFMDNDVKVAALGEAVLGAGKGYPIVYYVTVSTGIGGALVIDRKVVSGQNGHAGEIGNICIDRNREKYNILNAGAVENEASGTAITRKGRAVFGDSIHNAGDVFDLARSGDEKALEIVDNMAYDLAMMFSAIGHVVDPHVFVVGGGVMKGKDVFFEKMEKYYRSMIHEGMQPVVFKEAELEEPGIAGAAMLPMTRE